MTKSPHNQASQAPVISDGHGGEARLHSQRHDPATVPGLQFVDNHIHTELAYCSENMTVEKAIARAREVRLAGITFTEHAGQLYFDRKP